MGQGDLSTASTSTTSKTQASGPIEFTREKSKERKQKKRGGGAGEGEGKAAFPNTQNSIFFSWLEAKKKDRDDCRAALCPPTKDFCACLNILLFATFPLSFLCLATDTDEG